MNSLGLANRVLSAVARRQIVKDDSIDELSNLIKEKAAASDDALVSLRQELDTVKSELLAATGQLRNLDLRFNEYSRWIATFASAGSFEMQNRALRLLRLLRPRKVVGYSKIRLGSPNDGGYILIDDFQDIDAAFSFGIEQNAAWDLEIAARGIKVFQFDHTIEVPPAASDLLIFEPKQIAADPGAGKETLSDLVRRHRRHDKNATLILKIDIEHDEWPVFDATPLEDFNSFSQIICEFHGFMFLVDQSWYERAIRVFEKICSLFAVVHVHANNFCGINSIANVAVPEVLEISFANRGRYQLAESTELFPGDLDTPNDPTRADIFLGNFIY